MKRRKYLPVIKIHLIIVFLLVCNAAVLCGNAEYTETRIVLQDAYKGEMTAHTLYLAYSQAAMTEKYPHIAYLFKSLSESEGIHANNFKKAATDLNIQLEELGKIVPEPQKTKVNLKNAVAAEMGEIDGKYPDFIKRLEKEGGAEAVKYTTFAWKAEKQHKDLLKKILTYVDSFFSEVAKQIEKKSVTYYVCQNCGSTVTEIPPKQCPICAGATSDYKEIDET